MKINNIGLILLNSLDWRMMCLILIKGTETMRYGEWNKQVRFSVAICGLLFSTTVFSMPLPKGVTQVTEAEGIHEYRLSNGLKVLLLPDAAKPTITVNITYFVGSRHENYGESGMAHLLEHLVFKGTKKFPNITQEFSRRGINFNGTTSLDRTNYFETFQASNDNLKWALEMEASRMVTSFIAKKDLDSEMTVVRNEFERGENSPFSVLFKRMQSVAFDWHNYGNSTIGNRSDIEKVKIGNLQAFYHRYYQPDNAALVVAGKFDEAKTLQWISQAFGAIAKPKRALPEFWTTEPTQDGERTFLVRRKGDVQIVLVGYKSPSVLHGDNAALAFANDILTDTPNGRLHKLLVETGKATSVFGTASEGFAPGLQIVGVEIKKGEAIEPVRDALIAAIEAFAKTPPTPAEMERVHRSYANYFEKVMNNPQSLAIGLSESLASGDWRLFLNNRTRTTNVTAEQVAAVAATYFKRDNRTVGVFVPEDAPQRAEIPVAPSSDEVLRDFKPQAAIAAGENFDPAPTNINARTQQLKIGGLKVAFLPKKNRGETVNVAFTLHWGNEKTLFGQSAAAGFAGAMLTRGTQQFSRQQLADEFERLKVSGGVFGFETTRPNLIAALKLMASVLKTPTFPESEFEQLRKQSLTAIESSRNDPDTLASEALEKHFNRYPKGDWRANKTTDEQLAETKAITLKAVKDFYTQFYGASQGELAIVGDFDPAEVRQAVSEIYANWQSAEPYTRLPMRNFEVEPVHQLIDTPDKENGSFLAQMNLDRRDDDADYPALIVANYLFGGGAGLDSRLMQRVRQKEGLSYSIGSWLSIGSIDRAASFGIQAIAAPQNMLKVEAAVKSELERAVKDGFTAAEVAGAKSGLLQKRLQSRTRDGGLAGSWRSYLFLNRTFEWDKAIDDKIRALTVEQVNEAFRRAIVPSQLSIIMAFDQTKAKAASK